MIILQCEKVEYGVPVSSLSVGPKRNGVDYTKGQCLWIESLLTPPTNPASSYHFCRINKLYPQNPESLLFVACITLLGYEAIQMDSLQR